MEDINKITLREFAEKYMVISGQKPSWSERDLLLFDAIDEAREQNKELMILGRRTRPDFKVKLAEAIYYCIKAGKSVFIPIMTKKALEDTTSTLDEAQLKYSVEENTEKGTVGYIFKPVQ